MPIALPGYQAPGSLAALGQPLAGLNLNALAASGARETDQRVAGAGNLMDSYLASVLGERRALNQSEGERDYRLADFAKQRQLEQVALQESLANRQRAAEQSGDQVRIQASFDEGNRNRSFQGAQGELERAFELGQAAIARDQREREMEFERQARLEEIQLQNEAGMGQAMFEQNLQEDWFRKQLEIEEEASRPQISDFGTHEISLGRGEALARDGRIRERLAQNPEQWRASLAAIQKLVAKHGHNPSELRKRLQDRYHKHRSQDVVSYALHELGYELPT